MAPSHSRQLLTVTLPAIAIILSYLWFKRKRIEPQSDPGDNPPTQQETKNEKTLFEELQEATKDISPVGSPDKTFNRTLSTPIDIIIPRELRSQKTSPIVISDEDLDLQIEKIKSMKNTLPYNISRVSYNGSPAKQTPPKQVPIAQEPFVTKAKKSNNNNMPKPKLDLSLGKKSPAKATPKKKDISKIEEKLGNLSLEKEKSAKVDKKIAKKESEEEQRQSVERDSANHSPADVMLASPSLSSISDNHSEGSSDSGKGGSEVATPPSRTPAGDNNPHPGDINLPTVYEFLIPQTLVGKLIGRYGCFVQDIKEKTRAHVIVEKHPSNNKHKVCTIRGTQLEIENALRMIRDKFPAKRYPDVTLQQVQVLSLVPNVTNIPLTTDHLYLKLVEGTNNDTIISCMVAPDHLFLQQPTHPSYPSLHVLSHCMNACYRTTESPTLPRPIKENTICVAESVGEWCRAMILSSDEESDTSYLTFLDHGGYAVIENSKLRQIRGDFILLPFQAAECMLAHVKPAGGDTWGEEAYKLVSDLTRGGAIAVTQIAEYTEYGVPLVLLYIIAGQKVIYLNGELVKRGYAEYVDYAAPALEETEGAVGGVLA